MLHLALVFCEAGKREGLLWKEVDDGTTEMLPHISSVFNVLCLLNSSSKIHIIMTIYTLILMN